LQGIANANPFTPDFQSRAGEKHFHLLKVDPSCRVFCHPATEYCLPAKPGGNFHRQGGEIYSLGSLLRQQDTKTCGWKPFSGGRESKSPAGRGKWVSALLIQIE
jgi:hypothetical protein